MLGLRLPLRDLTALVLTAALAACADRAPTAVERVSAPPGRVQRLTCRAAVAARTLSCATEGRVPGGPSTDVMIVGAPFVALASDSAAYDAETGIFRAGVALKNLMQRPIGTTDGTTAAAEGIRVFFHSGPTVTQGTGIVEVENADGTGTFLGAVQPYFRYDTLLAPGETSTPREWRFSVPSTVERFEFVMYVSAPVQDTGWVDVSPDTAYVLLGDTFGLRSAIRNAAGGAEPGTVTWSSQNEAVATVDASGVVTGMSPGATYIDAASGPRTGRSWVIVTTTRTPPPLHSLSVSPTTVDVSGGSATVEFTFTAGAANGSEPVTGIRAFLRSDLTAVWCFAQKIAETDGTGTWRCSIAMSRFVPNGDHRILVQVFGALADATLFDSQLAERGFPSVVTVTGGSPDVTLPTLTGLAVAPDTVRVDDASAILTFTMDVSDEESGVEEVYAEVRTPDGSWSSASPGPLIAGTAANGTWQSTVLIPRDAPGGAWPITVRLRDEFGNERSLSSSDLRTAGFPAEVTVISPNDDPERVVTAFEFLPSSVRAGSETWVIFFIHVANAGTSGVDVSLRSPSGSATASCFAPPNGGNSLACGIFATELQETGTWTVERLEVREGFGARTLDTAALQAAGFPTTLTVTP